MLQTNGEYDWRLILMRDTMIEPNKRDWLSEGGDKFNSAILILALVNILAALGTAVSIIYEACCNTRRDFCPKIR
jgi:hypothetical protein